MTKSLRLLALSGTLALLVSPAFAGSAPGPGGSDPAPGSGSTVVATTNGSNSSTTTVIQTILAYLGL